MPQCQIWMASFSYADHILIRLRTSVILLKDVITSLRGIKNAFYLLGLILNLNLLCNEYSCLFLYAFNKIIIIPQYTKVSILNLNSDIVRILILFEYFFIVQGMQKIFGDFEISRTF